MRWLFVIVFTALLTWCCIDALGAEPKDDYRLLRFRADWCGPCHRQTKVYVDAKIQDELKRLKIEDVYVDVDKHPSVVKLWNVETIPTTLLVRVRVKNKATAVKRWGGKGMPLLDADQYREFVDPSKEGPTPPKLE